MPQLRFPIIALMGSALVVAAGVAAASTCYVVFDAKETIVYRASVPPVERRTTLPHSADVPASNISRFVTGNVHFACARGAGEK